MKTCTRHADRAVLLADGAVFVDREQAVRVVVLALKRLRLAGLVELVDAEHLQAALGVLRAQLADRRRLGVARPAPRREEVHVERLAAQLVEHDGLAARRRQRERRRGLPTCGMANAAAGTSARTRGGEEVGRRTLVVTPAARNALRPRPLKQATESSAAPADTKVPRTSGNGRPLSVSSQLCVRCFVSLPSLHWCCPRSARQRRARRRSAARLRTPCRRSRATGSARRPTAPSPSAPTSSSTAAAPP